MNLILGSIIVMACVLGGFALAGGHLIAIWQPLEILIICGAALGAFVIANPMKVVIDTFKAIPGLLKGPKYSKDDYLAVLGLMYDIFMKARKEGLMGVEADIEEPANSPLFQKYPTVLDNHHAVDFIADYMRLVISGSMNPFEVDNLMELELAIHHEEANATSHAVQRVADGLPAFGIVAAVLGIVHTMAVLDGPLNVIGGMVAAALVGTFLGILISYGFVGPIATALELRAEDEGKFLGCIKACILANLQGYNPQITVEFGRKSMPGHHRPSFQELEKYLRGG